MPDDTPDTVTLDLPAEDRPTPMTLRNAPEDMTNANLAPDQRFVVLETKLFVAIEAINAQAAQIERMQRQIEYLMLRSRR